MQMGQMLVLLRQSIQLISEMQQYRVCSVHCPLATRHHSPKYTSPSPHSGVFKVGIFILAMTEYICILYGASNQWDCAISSI